MDDLRAIDDASRAVQKTPNRVTLDSIEKKIMAEEYIYPPAIPHMTICLIVMQNGFAVIGKSAPVDPENFNEDLGKDFARADAVKQLWPLEAYLMRQSLMKK